MIRIGVAQVPQTADIERNLDKALEYMEKAAAQGVEMLCFPETHLPGYRVGVLEPDASCDGNGLSRASEIIRKKAADLSLGVIMGAETPNSAGKPFNSAQVIDERGNSIALHHKSKLTPTDALGYAFPFTGPTSFTFKGVPMGVVICFEGYRFPETTRSLAKAGAKIVFHPQFNHVIPTMAWKRPVHEALLVSRAAENTVWFISANMSHPCNNVRSMIVGPNGIIREAAILTREMLIMHDVDPELATHAFLKDDLDEMARALGEK